MACMLKIRMIMSVTFFLLKRNYTSPGKKRTHCHPPIHPKSTIESKEVSFLLQHKNIIVAAFFIFRNTFQSGCIEHK